MTHSRSLFEFLHRVQREGAPPEVLAAASGCLLDTLGCMLFGAPEPWARIMADEVFAESASGRATVVGRLQPAPAPLAALCNGTAAHGFELDDHLDEAIVHPGAIVVSAALAAAESVDATGERLLLGIIAGYEVLDRLGRAMGTGPSRRGWHKTAVAGPIGAAVAAAMVRGADAATLATAAGLACATASGTKAYASSDDGGMEKRMHAGRAAESGVRMAQLAARGFTAPDTAIEGRFGLLHVFAPDEARPELLGEGLGQRWSIQHVYVKLHPCCAWIQAATQQLVALRGPVPLAPQAVRRLRVGVSAYAGAQNGNPAPRDTMGAQFSIPYCAALAVTGDPADPASYAPAAIHEPGRRALAARVEVFTDTQMEAAYPRHYGARVELELADGRRLSGARLDPHGMPADPCTDEERVAKFRRLARRVLGPAAVDALAQAVERAPTLSSLHPITAPLRFTLPPDAAQ